MGYLTRNFDLTLALTRRAILDLVPPRPGGVLLDLGCGDGSFTLEVAAAARVERTVGIELISELGAAAAGRGIEVHAVDVRDGFPVDTGSVDVVHANQLIEHVASTDALLREIRRVLRPDGVAVLSTNNLSSLHNLASLALGWQPMPAHVSDEQVGVGNPLDPHRGAPGSKGQMHLRLFTGRALTELAAMHGLTADVARGVGFYPLPPRAANVAARLLPRWSAYLVHRYRAAGAPSR